MVCIFISESKEDAHKREEKITLKNGSNLTRNSDSMYFNVDILKILNLERDR